MATQNTKTRAKRASAKPADVDDVKTAPTMTTDEQADVASTEPEAKEGNRKMIPKDIDPHMYVTVRNGFQGRLVYKSKKTGERFVWDTFGSEQEMELNEVRNARNSNKKYFVNNWFMFDEPWVVDYVGMGQYYKFAIAIDEFDSLFEKSGEEIEETISKLSDGQKKSVAYRARQLVAEGGIDSNRTIAMLEKCLGVELIEHDK